jgi:hypothetical protein
MNFSPFFLSSPAYVQASVLRVLVGKLFRVILDFFIPKLIPGQIPNAYAV